MGGVGVGGWFAPIQNVRRTIHKIYANGSIQYHIQNEETLYPKMLIQSQSTVAANLSLTANQSLDNYACRSPN